jgi:FkbM family methyltransferase
VDESLTRERLFREDFTQNIMAELRHYIDVKIQQLHLRTPMHWPEGGRIFMHTVDGHRLYLDSSEPFMALHLVEHGEWERPVRDLLRKLLRAGDLYIDVGANIGVHTLLASNLVGVEGSVIAIEPHPLIRTLLNENLEVNGLLERVEVVAAAVSDVHDGSASFEYFPQHAAMSGFRVSAERIAQFRGTPQEIQVPTVTLDALVAKAGRAPDLVKIDVEGFELLVLRGSQDVLAAAHDTAFLIEYTADLVASLMDETAVQRMSSLFEENGFMPYRVEDNGVTAIDHAAFCLEEVGDYLFIRPGGRHAKALGF